MSDLSHHDGMLDRIEELEAENKRLRLEVAHANDTADASINYVGTLEAKLAKAVEALEFYAEANNYEDQHKPESCGCCYYLHDAEIKEDEGAKARATLAEIKGESHE